MSSMTVLRHRVLNDGQPVVGLVATVMELPPETAHGAYRRVKTVTAYSNHDGWLRWELPKIVNDSLSVPRYVVSGIEPYPIVVAVPLGVSTATVTETRIGVLNNIALPQVDLVTEDEIAERLAGVTAELTAGLITGAEAQNLFLSLANELGDTGAIPSTVARRDESGWLTAKGLHITDQPDTPDAAARKDYVDGIGTSANVPGAIMRRDGNGGVDVSQAWASGLQPPEPHSLTRKDYVDGAVAPLAADLDAASPDASAAGALVRRDEYGSIGTEILYGLSAPVTPSDATNKAYVDALGTDESTASTVMRRSASNETAVGALFLGTQSQPGHATRKDYVDALGTPNATPNTVARRDANGGVRGKGVFSDKATIDWPDELTRKDYVDSGVGARVAKAGDTMTGDLFVPNLGALKTVTLPNTYTAAPDSRAIAQAPFADLWHDLLAFGRHAGFPTLETSADGATWTAPVAATNSPLFNRKNNQGAATITATTKYHRYTWNHNNFAYCAAVWLVIGYNYAAPAPTKRVLVESSADGTTWTVRHDSTSSTVGAPVWHKLADNGGDTRFRITIHNQGTVSQVLNGMMLLTSRWGDQGGGSELELPYDWGDDRSVLFVQARSSTAPSGVSDLTRKDYVDALGTNASTADTVMRRSSGNTVAVGQVDLTSVAPTQASHAARKDYVDAIGTALATASTIVRRDASGNTAIDAVTLTDTPTAVGHATRKDYVDSGDTAAKSRVNHTGTQASATISDLTETVQDIVDALIAAGTGLTKTYDDATGLLTLTVSNAGGTTDPEIVRDVIGGAIVQGSGIIVTVNDAGDTITIASSAVLPTRQVIAGTGLTGGGDLSADRTLAVSYGTTAGTAAQGNDSRITGAVQTTRSVISGTGLTGGGTLAADRTLAVSYGSTAGTAVQGNDTRVTADQAAATASIRTLGTGAQQAAAGNDSRFTNARTPTAHASTHASGGLDPLPAELIGVAATGITATNVRDALLELLGMTDDSGSYWSSTPKSLANTTLSADSDLNVPIGANEHMWLDWYFTFSGATAGTANLKASLSLPAGATAAWGSALDYDAAGSAGAAKGLLGTQTDTKTFKLANGTIGVHIRGRVDNGATAGTVVINLAQNTADATPVTRDSWAKVTVDRAV